MYLVFGTNGQVATELRLQGSSRVKALSRKEADLLQPSDCAEQILAYRPAAVINAAAYTAVDRAEDEENIAHIVNGAAPGAMADACVKLDIPFLHISTDYVFDGTGSRPHKPDDPTLPQNAYGRTKLAGETFIQDAGGRFGILRTSWVFSEHGSNFVKTMLRLGATRSSLTVVDDQIGGPTPASGIAVTLLQMADALVAGHQGGVFHYAGQPETSWADFARETFELAGCAVEVTGIPTIEYPTPAARPLNSRLDCSSLTSEFGIHPPDWKSELSRVIKALT